MLRDPIDSAVATYYDGENRKKYKDFAEFIDDKSNQNLMTKYISGADVNAWYDVNMQNEAKLINGNDYVMARNNLMSMGWIGLFNDLQNSVDQLAYFWNLEKNENKIKTKAEINKNFDKPFNIKLTVSEHESILKRNKWDVMLYELAIVLHN